MSRIIRPVITKETKEIEIRDMLVRDFFTPDVPSREEVQDQREQQLAEMEQKAAAEEQRLLEMRRQFQHEMEQERSRWQEEKILLQQEAYDEGFQQGFEEGRSKGYSEVAQALSEANAVMTHAGQQAEKYLEEQEWLILELAITSAAHILDRSLTETPEAFLPIIKKALKEAREADKVKLYVSPELYVIVTESREELTALLPADVPLMVFAEETLSPQEGYIETNYGRVVFSADEQLAELRQKLMELLERGIT